MAKGLTDEQKDAIAEIVFEKWDENKTDLKVDDHNDYILYLQGLGDTHYYLIIEEFMEAPDNDEYFNEPSNYKELND